MSGAPYVLKWQLNSYGHNPIIVLFFFNCILFCFGFFFPTPFSGVINSLPVVYLYVEKTTTGLSARET